MQGSGFTINCEDDGNSTREQHGTVAPPVLLQVRWGGVLFSIQFRWEIVQT